MKENSFPTSYKMNDIKYITTNAAGYRLFFNERDSDVAIKVEYEGQRWHFPAHKLVLSTMSEVFRTMLEVDMIEKRSKVITIRDSSPYSVKQFLRYLYMGVIDFNCWSEAVAVLKVAHKYSVQTLINICETYLASHIVFNNSCLLYELARTYSLKVLKKETKDFILQAGFIVSSTEGFFNLKSRSLECFVSSPNFNMENEGCILTSLREWAVCECSRNCIPLTRINVLTAMEPFLKHISWNSIPESHRTFIPKNMVEENRNGGVCIRKNFHVPGMLQNHMSYIKFVLELGAFQEDKIFVDRSLICLKFCVDSHAFLTGFRIVGLFHINGNYETSSSFLTLGRDDCKAYVQFNLNSLPWTRGSTVGDSVWREMIAYLPYPIRVNPFSTYILSFKVNRPLKLPNSIKWPKTRLESESVHTNLGTIHFSSSGPSYGITQLFMLPAPPYRDVCNLGNDD